MHMDLRGEGKTGESSIEVILKASGVDGISWGWGGSAYREEPWTEPLGPPTFGDSVGEGEGLGSWIWCPRSQEKMMFQEGESAQFCSISMRGQDGDPKVTVRI